MFSWLHPHKRFPLVVKKEKYELSAREEKGRRRRLNAVSYFQNCNATANNNVVANVFHNAGSLASNERQQYRSFVQVPEQEELAPRGSCTTDMPEQISSRVPKNTLETENNLRGKSIDMVILRGNNTIRTEASTSWKFRYGCQAPWDREEKNKRMRENTSLGKLS